MTDSLVAAIRERLDGLSVVVDFHMRELLALVRRALVLIVDRVLVMGDVDLARDAVDLISRIDSLVPYQGVDEASSRPAEQTADQVFRALLDQLRRPRASA